MHDAIPSVFGDSNPDDGVVTEASRKVEEAVVTSDAKIPARTTDDIALEEILVQPQDSAKGLES